jgi:hypothetical protein
MDDQTAAGWTELTEGDRRTGCGAAEELNVAVE